MTRLAVSQVHGLGASSSGLGGEVRRWAGGFCWTRCSAWGGIECLVDEAGLRCGVVEEM